MSQFRHCEAVIDRPYSGPKHALMQSMKFITAAFILCALLYVKLDRADAATTHTVKGLVITSDGTVVPEFTVVVKHLTDKPELVRRLNFKDGEFNVDELPVGKYQLQISAPLFIGARLVFDFTGHSSETDYRIVVLHLFRNEPRLIPESAHTVSVKVLQQKIPPAPEEAYKTAVDLHREGKLNEAMMSYGKALRYYPQYIDALTDIGTVLLLFNRPDSALVFLRRAQAVDDSNVIVNLNIAVSLTEQGDYGGALKIVKEVL